VRELCTLWLRWCYSVSKIKTHLHGGAAAGELLYDIFYVLLTVHFSIFILVINQLDAQNFVLH